MEPKQFKQRHWVYVCIYALVIFGFSAIPGDALPREVSIADYLLHLIEYLPFGFLLTRALKKSCPYFSLQRIVFLSILCVGLYGITDEIHQFFVPGRTMSAFDLCWDIIGGFIGSRIA